MNASPENHDSAQLDDLPDRLIDVALAELIGGKSPPDLSAQITAATTFRPTAVVAPAPRMRATRAFWASLALAIMLLVGVTIVVVPQVRSAREQGSIAKAANEQGSKQI